jgi:uncharacterized protein YbaP (TraB family)
MRAAILLKLHFMKKIGAFLLLLISAFSVKAQLLWEVSGNGLAKPSYLYGTIHLVKKKDFKVSPVINEKLSETDQLIMEMDMDFGMSEMLEMAKKMMLPKGKTIEDYCTAEEYARLKKYCMDTVGMKESKFLGYSKMTPFFFSSILLKEQLGDVEAYEEYFKDKAKKSKKPIVGLETLTEQMNTVDAMSIEDQKNMLFEALGKELVEFEKMYAMYEKQNLDGLYSYIQEESKSTPEFERDFLVKRNQKWIPLIKGNIIIKPSFIAVGAAHLAGDQGVIALLRNEGYTVQPVK